MRSNFKAYIYLFILFFFLIFTQMQTKLCFWLSNGVDRLSWVRPTFHRCVGLALWNPHTPHLLLSFCKNQRRSDKSILLELEGRWRLTNESVNTKSQFLQRKKEILFKQAFFSLIFPTIYNTFSVYYCLLWWRCWWWW